MKPPFIVAELSANHGGSFHDAFVGVLRAKECGADAIKLQTYTPDTLTIDCDRPDFFVPDGIWKGQKLYDLYRQSHTPWEWHKDLFNVGSELGIEVFSTPFDVTAVSFLEGLGCPRYKVASFELLDAELLRAIAITRKPVIVSTGMASLQEIGEALRHLGPCLDITLLHCVSSYPTAIADANLSRMATLAREFGLPVGLSDHTTDETMAMLAVALGATVIEKHFNPDLQNKVPLLDESFSLKPAAFLRMVNHVKTACEALGDGSVEGTDGGSQMFRRSIYAINDIAPQEQFSSANVRVIRPGFGLHPRHLWDVLGKVASQPIARGTALKWELVA